MIVITVIGVSENYDKGRLLKACNTIGGIVQGRLRFLGVEKVAVFFPKDLLSECLGEEVVIKVENFSGKTIIILQDLKRELEKLLLEAALYWFPDAGVIAVKVFE